MIQETDLTPALVALDQHLAQCSYIGGHTPSQADSLAYGQLARVAPTHNGLTLQSRPHLARWYNHITSFGPEVKDFPTADLGILSQLKLPHARLPQVIPSFSFCSWCSIDACHCHCAQPQNHSPDACQSSTSCSMMSMWLSIHQPRCGHSSGGWPCHFALLICPTIILIS